MTETHATREFDMIWENDYDLYLATLAYARDLLRRTPNMTDQTLGRNVKDRVFAWAFGGGWGWSDFYPHDHRAFDYFLKREQHGDVQDERVGERVRDALGIEGELP